MNKSPQRPEYSWNTPQCFIPGKVHIRHRTIRQAREVRNHEGTIWSNVPGKASFKVPPIFCHQQFSKQIFQNWQPKRTYKLVKKTGKFQTVAMIHHWMEFLGSKFNIVKIMSDVKLDDFPQG